MKTNRQLKEQYPKCFRPIHPKLKIESVVFPENRPPFKEWWLRISKN